MRDDRPGRPPRARWRPTREPGRCLARIEWGLAVAVAVGLTLLAALAGLRVW